MEENLSLKAHLRIRNNPDYFNNTKEGVTKVVNLLELENLAISLGFVENLKLKLLRQKVYTNRQNRRRFNVLHGSYVDLARMSLTNNGPEGQIAIILMEAILYYEIGDMKLFKDNIWKAYDYAENFDMMDLFYSIREIWRKLKK